MGDRPVCPMCKEPGIHATVQRCIDALKAERDRLKTQVANRPTHQSIKALGHFVPGYHDY